MRCYISCKLLTHGSADHQGGTESCEEGGNIVVRTDLSLPLEIPAGNWILVRVDYSLVAMCAL